MSEYARRNLACSSWRKAPRGWNAWGGNVSGWTARPFCDDEAGHAGNHRATIYKGESFDTTAVMAWPNTLGIPKWLMETTIHGLRMLREHTYERDQDECWRLDQALDMLDPFLTPMEDDEDDD